MTSRPSPLAGEPATSLRILQLVQAPQRRGAETFARDLSHELRARGHAVATLYLYRHQGSGGLEMEPSDVSLEGRPEHPFEKVPGWHPGLARRLAHEIDRFRPRIVQANGARTVKYGALLRRTSPRASWRLVYRNIGDPRVWQGAGPRRLAYRLLVLPGIDAIAALSQRNLDAFRDLYGFRGTTAVVPNGVTERLGTGSADPEDPRPLRERCGAPPEAPVILFVGRLSAEKRPDRLARVFATVRARRPDARLWVVGDGPERPRLDAEIERLALGDNVTAWGHRNDVTPFYREADLLLLTSDTEGMPGVVLEAGLAGLPTVAPGVGDLAACVRDEETGLLVEPGDEEALAAAVLRLLDAPERARALGAAARRDVGARFTMPVVATAFEDLYRRTLAAGGGVS